MLPLRTFVIESMALSYVNDPVSLISDIAAHEKFCQIPTLTVEDICGFARAIDPKADYVKSPQHTDALKDVLLNMNVAFSTMKEADRLQGHDSIESPAQLFLARPKDAKPEQRDWAAYLTYRAFMELKPFVVGAMNGIVGRALWLWVMGGKLELTFLHVFHDQALRFGGVAEIKEKKRVTN